MRASLRLFGLCCAVSLVACGKGANNGNTNNGDTNNGVSNNGTNNGVSNNGATNNGATNNGATNNGQTNNGQTNNGQTNNGVLPIQCATGAIDEGGDGSVEQRHFVEYDQDGRIRVFKRDLDNDGAYDWEIQNTWDGAGNLIEQLTDSDGDGTFDVLVEYGFDLANRLVSARWDVGNDGSDEFVHVTRYDDDGQLIDTRRDGRLDFEGTGVDEVADGTFDYVRTKTWAGPGKPLSEAIDANNDGVDDYVATWTYDASMNLSEYTQDGTAGFYMTNPDGTPWLDPPVFEYADGTVDYRISDIIHDAAGRITEETVDGRLGILDAQFSRRAGGIPDLRRHTYDAEGNQTSMALDEANDGSIDFELTFEYDADGNLVGRTRDGVVDNMNTILAPADGTIDERLTGSYLGGRPLRVARDFADDGTDDAVTIWLYDGAGRTAHYEQDGSAPDLGWILIEPADGIPDISLDWTYDTRGRIMSHRFEANGVLERTETWFYAPCTELE